MPEQLAVMMASGPAELQRGVRRRWFYVGAGVFVILLSFAGFGPSLIDHSRRTAPPTPLLIVHGASALGWLLLFLAQAALVANRRMTVHRRLGWAGFALAAVVIVLGFHTSIDSSRRPVDLSGDVTRLLVAPGSPPPTEAQLAASVWGPLGVLVNFGILVAAGLWYRHRPEVHKRFMVFALQPLAFESILHLSGALVGRVPVSREALTGMFFAASILLFAVPAIHDKVSQGRVHPVSVWVPVLSILWAIVVNAVVAPSAVGYQVGAWLLR